MTPEQIEVEGMRLSAPQDYDHEQTFANRYIAPMFEQPLLAQCAALLDSLLGGPVAGIVYAALAWRRNRALRNDNG